MLTKGEWRVKDRINELITYGVSGMQTVMSNFIKLLFCLWQGACWDSFLFIECLINENRNINITSPY